MSVELLVMSLENSWRTHPLATRDHCEKCGRQVQVYPSGQAIIERYGRKEIRLICDICMDDPFAARPASGSLAETAESVPTEQPPDE